MKEINLRKLLLLLIVVVLAFVLAACGEEEEDNDNGSSDPTEAPAAEATEAAAEAAATEAAAEATVEAAATEAAAEATVEAAAPTEAAAEATVEAAAPTEAAAEATVEAVATEAAAVEVAAATEEAVVEAAPTEEAVAVATEAVEVAAATEETVVEAAPTEEVVAVATEEAVAAATEEAVVEAAPTEEAVAVATEAVEVAAATEEAVVEAAATEEVVAEATEAAGEAAVLEVDETLGTEDNPITLLFIPSENAQEVQAGADQLSVLLSEATGLTIEAVVSTDYAAAIEAMCGGEAEIGALNTFSYILAHERGCADVGVVSTRFDSPFYSGQVITLADSGIESLADLAGGTFCRPDPLSTSGWIIPSIAMQAAGVDLGGLEIIDAGGHDGVVTSVYNGDCIAGATFVDARSNVEEEFPDVMEKIVVIAESAPIPNDTLSYAPSLSAETQQAITDALVAIVADETNGALLDQVYGWTGLTDAEDSFYDDFREQLDAAGVDIESLQ
jgi:phosphonate transport system substrate-binding protein